MPVASERSPSDNVLQRVVSKQSQMAGTAAGTDTGSDRDAGSLHPLGGQPVQVGRLGRLQFGLAPRLHRQSAQSVGDQHDDLGFIADVQLTSQLMDVHGFVPSLERPVGSPCRTKNRLPHKASCGRLGEPSGTALTVRCETNGSIYLWGSSIVARFVYGRGG